MQLSASRVLIYMWRSDKGGVHRSTFRALAASAILVVLAMAGFVVFNPISAPASPAVGSAPQMGDSDAPAPPITAQPQTVVGQSHVTGDPAALPGDLLISDRGNSRVLEIGATGNIVWQFPPPGYKGPIPFWQNDDAFLAPDGRHVTTNEEFEHTIQVIDRTTNAVSWYYGTPYVPGSGPNLLNRPDDAYMLPDGRIMAADIRNCRIVLIDADKHLTQLGHTGVCRHDPAGGYLASPNGDAPSSDYRHVVVTEIGGSWVDVFSLPDFRYEYSFRSPAQYPSDAIMQADGTFILTDYVSPGAVYRVDRNGNVLWRYDRQLDHPSIAISLPNGDVCISDDYGDRVIIVEPSTNTIVWQYGVKNQPGVSAGHLYVPDGLDFVPPSLKRPSLRAGYSWQV